ncbi:hypothetical protein K7H91_22575 [Martelella mediterranea]|uniref:hypothetical protein n=1 Tax=Martelella mediterranea TaxID=293089 RepID=UPI001E5286A5|nr:hypothetical protein [Martelella mediterranea]MCD1636545.1 hypothetical protein [Martelella mediterranea]
MMSGQSSLSIDRRSSLNPLQEAAQKLADYARFQGRYKARELVGLLSSQSERAARSIAPAVKIHIYIAGEPEGRMPVNLRLR